MEPEAPAHPITPTPNWPALQAAVQQHGSTVFEYLLLPDRLVCWIIQPDGALRLVQTAVGRGVLEAHVAAFLATLEMDGDDAEASAIANLRALAGYLIDPIPADCWPPSPDAVLTIVPHGRLFQVPFAALPAPDGTYLIARHPLAYMPALGILPYTRLNQAQAASRTAPTLLALVNPQPQPDNQPPLHETAALFAGLSDLYPHPEANRIIYGTDATRQQLQVAASNYTVLYFATHAEGTDDPQQAWVALADLPPGGGYLRVPQILQLALRADLVVLAACTTARGQIASDGVVGLSRAFFVAGAASVLGSLWPVDEYVTMMQMAIFHEAWLGAQQSKAQALQAAQRAAWRDYGDPRVWAGFVLIGEWN
jgi:CHAT domain-containing protein